MSRTPDDDTDPGAGAGETDGEAAADFALAWPAPTWDMELRAPLVTKAEETLTHLNLREPTMAEFETIMAWPAATRRRKAVSLIAAVTMDDVARIGVGDVVRAEAYLTSFFDVGQVIGVG